MDQVLCHGGCVLDNLVHDLFFEREPPLFFSFVVGSRFPAKTTEKLSKLLLILGQCVGTRYSYPGIQIGVLSPYPE